MIKKHSFCILIIILFFASDFYAFHKANNQKHKTNISVKLPNYFYKRFEGTINKKMKIVMNLTRMDTLLTGNYYYEKGGQPITFTRTSRIDSEGNIYIGEATGNYDKNYKPIVSGAFTGKFIDEHEIRGTWENPRRDIKYIFILKENYPPGSAEIEILNYSKHYRLKGKGASACFNIVFPKIIRDINKNTADTINNSFVDSLLNNYNYGGQNKEWNNFNEITDDFIKTFKAFVKTDTLYPRNYVLRWVQDFTTKVVFNSKNILSVKTIEFRFEGGAHPNTFITNISNNLKTGKAIKLDDILAGNYQPVLNKFGEAKLRQFYKINPSEDLKKAGFFIENFVMNNNFLLTQQGLEFQFNQYEIAPYAWGAPVLFIPYSDLKEFIKQGSLIHRLIK